MFARVIDHAQGDATAEWLFGLFVLGNIAGTALFGAALLRSRAVPAWAAIAVLAWPALHITGLAAGSEWFEVAGAALQAVGFAALGVAVLRTADHQWEPSASHISAAPVIAQAAAGGQARPGSSDLADRAAAGSAPDGRLTRCPARPPRRKTSDEITSYPGRGCGRRVEPGRPGRVRRQRHALGRAPGPEEPAGH